MIAEVLEPHRYSTFPAERDMLIALVHQTEYLSLTYTAMVEIGAFEGETTEVLARHRHGRPFYVIDPWDGTQDGADADVYAHFQARMAAALVPGPAYHVAYDTTAVVTPPITVLRQRSQDVTPPPHLGFVFHDGDHRDLSDLPTWWAALMPGGILAVHDTGDPGWPEVRAAVEALGRPWHDYRYLPTEAERDAYGPGLRGFSWKVKPR